MLMPVLNAGSNGHFRQAICTFTRMSTALTVSLVQDAEEVHQSLLELQYPIYQVDQGTRATNGLKT